MKLITVSSYPTIDFSCDPAVFELNADQIVSIHEEDDAGITKTCIEMVNGETHWLGCSKYKLLDLLYGKDSFPESFKENEESSGEEEEEEEGWLMRADVGNGKYSVRLEKSGHLHAYRFGKPWRDCSGDKLIYALAAEVECLYNVVRSLDSKIDDHDRTGSKWFHGNNHPEETGHYVCCNPDDGGHHFFNFFDSTTNLWREKNFKFWCKLPKMYPMDDASSP